MLMGLAQIQGMFRGWQRYGGCFAWETHRALGGMLRGRVELHVLSGSGFAEGLRGALGCPNPMKFEKQICRTNPVVGLASPSVASLKSS